MDALTVFDDGIWTIRKILSRAGAVNYGRREWCTARESCHYDHTYNAALGDLYIFHVATKSRPQYQMFLSRQGYLEFRNGGNIHASFQEVFAENGGLLDWYKDTIQPNVMSAKAVLSPRIRTTRDFFRESDLSHLVSNVGPAVDGIIGSQNQRAFSERFGSSLSTFIGDRINQETLDRIQASLAQAVLHVHRQNELPESPPEGTLCHRSDTNQMLIYANGEWVPLGDPGNYSIGVSPNPQENTISVTFDSMSQTCSGST